jgi:hypothetical protein
MTGWTGAELQQIGAADELHVAPRRRDGSLRGPVTIWVVRSGEDIYIRSVRGPAGGWFRGVQDRHEGRIEAGGIGKDVTFIDVTDGIDEAIDTAYREKYSYFPSAVDHITSPEARSTTLKVVPR